MVLPFHLKSSGGKTVKEFFLLQVKVLPFYFLIIQLLVYINFFFKVSYHPA